MARSRDYEAELRSLSSVGSWRITGALGAGGFGTVLRAQKQAIDGSLEYAAIKVLNEQVETQSERHQFVREYSILRQVRSDYVARVLDSGRSVDIKGRPVLLPWIATELIQGSDLTLEIERYGPLDVPQWFELAHDLLSAVSVTHASGVMHLDIKPDNVMRWARRSILVDFGIASFASQHDLAVSLSVPWSSPEQLSNVIRSEPISYASDLFSVGRTLAFAGTGRQPWPIEAPADLETTVRTQLRSVTRTPPDLAGLHPSQLAILGPLLNADPRRRGTAAQALDAVRRQLPPGSSRGVRAPAADDARSGQSRISVSDRGPSRVRPQLPVRSTGGPASTSPALGTPVSGPTPANPGRACPSAETAQAVSGGQAREILHHRLAALAAPRSLRRRPLLSASGGPGS